jgi:hypothetical protein
MMTDPLTILAERMVLTYEEGEDASGFPTFAGPNVDRGQMVRALRRALHSEIQKGNLVLLGIDFPQRPRNGPVSADRCAEFAR